MWNLALQQVDRRIVRCRQCPRLRDYCSRIARAKRRAFSQDTYWGRPVPGFGDPGAGLLIVGLAPAAHGANRTGRVFTGDGSGDFLMQALFDSGFANQPTSRSADDGLRLVGAFITAAVKCAPPANKPAPAEIAACRRHLAAELAALPRVRVLVALGRVAFDACLVLAAGRGVSIRPRPQFGHGLVHELGHGLDALVASYHPSRQNTNTGRLTQAMLHDVFRTACKLLHER
jgi:uracil-DNA glycosylase family 4